MCSSCHVISNREYRERQRAELAKIDDYKDQIEAMQVRINLLEDENIRLLARMVVAEAAANALRPYGVSREMGNSTQAA